MLMLPVQVYGLEVPPGDVLVPASIDFPATFRITMAAIDPSEAPEPNADGNVPAVPRSTLKLVKQRFPSDDNSDMDDDALQALLGGEDSDEEGDSEEDDDEPNGGPSDPAKSKKARQEAAIAKLLESTRDESDEDMEDAGKPNGAKPSKKGKQPATGEDEDEDDESDEDSLDGQDMEQFVVCTLDTERNYQQPIDITIGEDEKVYFIVSGSHTIYLTGNYVVDEDESDDDDSEYDDDDFPPDMLEEDMDDEMSDELDDIDEHPRITEVDSEDDVPKLVAAVGKKNKNKRPAEEAAESLDDLIAKSNGADGAKLSKKQLKKLKNNKGEAVAAQEEKDASKSDKKVQFAKNLEQGPTGSTKPADKAAEKKATVGVKVVQGVTIDDRKIGSGRAVKAGDKVGVRYIGKLENGKQFDANKKGPAFQFKVGKGEVIKGWDVGVVGMSVGGERRLTIPAQLGYGKKGAGSDIPPNSTLVFDVKLLEIK